MTDAHQHDRYLQCRERPQRKTRCDLEIVFETVRADHEQQARRIDLLDVGRRQRHPRREHVARSQPQQANRGVEYETVADVDAFRPRRQQIRGDDGKITRGELNVGHGVDRIARNRATYSQAIFRRLRSFIAQECSILQSESLARP